MPTFQITSPDGIKYRITGPEGATEEDALAQLQSELAKPKSQPVSFGEAVGKLWDKPPPGPSLIGFAKQLWEGATLPRDVAQGKVNINALLMPREEFTDIPAPEEHGANATPGILGNTVFAPRAAHPSDELIGRTAALATLPTLAPTVTAGSSFTGGILGSGPARATEGVPVLADKAAKIIAQRMVADKVNPQELAATALEAAKAGAGTVTPLDLGGPNVTRLAGTTYRTGGDAAERIATTLGQRAEGQGERLSQGITENLANPDIAYSTAEAIAKSRSAAAKNAYGEAYAHPLDATSPGYQNILDLLATDAGQAAMKKAAVIISNEERSPKFRPFTVDKETGEISLARPPDTRTLHYVLRGLDDVIDANKVADSFGKTKLTQLGGTVQGVKDAIRSELFDLNPKFRAANNAYASASELRSAIETGMDFLGKPAEVIKQEMAKLSDAGKEMYRLGAARALQGKIGRMMPEADKTSGLRSPEFNKQLAEIFPNDASLQRTQTLIQFERKQAQQKNAVVSGSQTAERMAADGRSLQTAMGVLGELGRGDVKRLLGRGVDWYVTHKLGLNDPKVAAEVANLLTTAIRDPKEFAQAMKRIDLEYRQLKKR